VILTLTATDSSGVASMRFSNDGVNWSVWEPYATSKDWTLVSGDGTRTVRVQYQDIYENGSSSYSDSIVVDSTPPSTLAAPTDAGLYTGSTSVTFNWNTSSDPQSGILGYNCRVGTTPGGSDIFEGSTGTSRTKTITGGFGTAYYCQAQAQNRAGLLGAWSDSSNGIFVVSHPDIGIPDAKALADGQSVGIASSEVTLYRDGAAWIEEALRVSGVQVVPRNGWSATPSVGHLAVVAGIVSTNTYGERFIDALTETAVQAPTIRPVGMSSRAVGGENWQYDPVTKAGQRGPEGGVGANNVGLLVRTWGLITRIDSSTFTVSDGAGEPVRCVIPVGVTLDPGWTYVCVTGVCALVDIEGAIKPCVYVRSQADLTAF